MCADNAIFNNLYIYTHACAITALAQRLCRFTMECGLACVQYQLASFGSTQRGPTSKLTCLLVSCYVEDLSDLVPVAQNIHFVNAHAQEKGACASKCIVGTRLSETEQ